MARKKQKKKARRQKRSSSRKLSLILAFAISFLLAVYSAAGVWFVHHPREWISKELEENPLLSASLLWVGNPVGDITDALNLTGRDVVYEYDEMAPAGSVAFAGLPVRTGANAPSDVKILDRGEFIIGWSDSLRHPLWCAYHVIKDSSHIERERPNFTRDKQVPLCPGPKDYYKSGYDRGHMAPNHAIASRYGASQQKQSFLMSNVVPQTPQLNRGVWRVLEHRIADLWTARYGEIWVVVGCVPSRDGEKIPGTDIDVPSAFYQVIIAQEGLDIRMLATYFPADTQWNAWAARHIVSVDELEEITGLDFNSELPDFIERPLEAELPSRLWPIRPTDIIRQILLRFK
jgi:endonuclease G